MSDTNEAPGCRDAALATGFLLGFGVSLFAIGLTLISRDSCSGLCETLGLTFLYAGGPISAIFGVSTDTVVAAWPLDVTLWVLLGFWTARRKTAGKAPLSRTSLLILLIAGVYGLVLSQLVELVG